MLEQKIQFFKQKLKEQIELAKDQKTLGDFDNIIFGFVEIIDNDPFFSKFIDIKLRQEWSLGNAIGDKYNLKEGETKNDVYNNFKNSSFWHKYYDNFKSIHDSIKLERCEALGIEIDNSYDWHTFRLKCEECKKSWDERKKTYNETLSINEKNEAISYFEEFYNALVGLINSDNKLLIEIEKENNLKKTDTENKEAVKVIYDQTNNKSIVKHIKEEIPFTGRRALMLSFFFDNQDEEKTFHDFNAWKKNNKNRISDIDSSMFRQEIEEINERLEKESKYITQIIESSKNTAKNKTKANSYKFKVKLKKLNKK